MILRQLKYRYFKGFRRMVFFDHLLDSINDIRREIFFATVRADFCGHIFNCNKFSLIPLRICDIFRANSTMANRAFIHNLFPPNFVIDPFLRVWFIYSYNTNNWQKPYLNMQSESFLSKCILYFCNFHVVKLYHKFNIASKVNLNWSKHTDGHALKSIRRQS